MAELSVLNQKISYIKIDDEDYISRYAKIQRW